MPLDAPRSALTQIGNYDILTKIAEGGMGTVYKGRHRQTGLVVALKIIPPTTARNPVLLQRFEREFQAAHTLDHPNIVKAIEYCGTGSSPFLVMEFVEGESLGQKIEREGRMPEVEAVRILAQVCQGLHRAHKMGMIHRDVKPDNIMVTPDGVAKLTDLGLVKDIEGELNLTRTGRGLGTPHFMAPEQFRNAKNADVRCDVYSLGATLYMMVTGEMPFGNCGPLDAWMKKVHNDFTPPLKLVPTLSERVDWAIRRSMSGDPEQRPTSCREFVEDLTGHSTRSTLSVGVESAQTDLWYLVYQDDEGQSHTVKGTTDAIRRALKDGLLGDASNIRACHSKAGPFLPLRGYPEFRDLVVGPAVPGAPIPTSGTPIGTPKPASGGYGRPTLGPSAPTDNDAVDLGGPLVVGRDGSGHSGTRRAGGGASGRLHGGSPSGRLPAPHPQSGRLPHIQLHDKAGGTSPTEWLLWVAVLGVALITAFAAFYYFGPMPPK